MEKRQPPWQYIVVQEDMIVLLAMKVNELIEKGFKPIGGVAVGKTSSTTHYGEKTVYCQAMIREVKCE